ncbi:hypothetical protein KP509_17G021300 [Ceratopteris richardii]|uniref:Uncharacterized protein n=1 Tax=Ceratopteris richardii TaxID=49495 RepID=A0A8T2STE7_CERRI|nr:hypothetical protein KP509_17G021300 [Ceratopteris richardii]
MNPIKPTLEDLFRKSSREFKIKAAGGSPSAPSHFARTPATDRSRLSRVPHAEVRPSTAVPPLSKRVAFQDDAAYAASDATSDVFTATAGGFSMDESLMLSGPLRPAHTPSEAREFIMHRFLPAAQTIANELPQTPGRPCLGAGADSGIAFTRHAQHNGSFRDYGRVETCTDSWLGSAPKSRTTDSPTLFTSQSSVSTPLTRQFREESLQSDCNEIEHNSSRDEELDDDDEDENHSAHKACGLFPFHIHISIHGRHRGSCSTPSSLERRHRKKNENQHRKSSRKTCHKHIPQRSEDVRHQCKFDRREDEYLFHHLQNMHLDAERMRYLRQPVTRSYSPSQHQSPQAQWPLSDSNSEAAADSVSCYDSPTGICNPSPRTLHHQTKRASQVQLPSLLEDPKIAKSSVCLAVGNPYQATINSVNEHYLHPHLCYCSSKAAIDKWRTDHAYIGSPSDFNILPSNAGFFPNGTGTGYHPDTSKGTHANEWDEFSHSNISKESSILLDSAVYDSEEQENVRNKNLSCPSTLRSKVDDMNHTVAGMNRGRTNKSDDVNSCTHTEGYSHISESSESPHGSNGSRQKVYDTSNGDSQKDSKGNARIDRIHCDSGNDGRCDHDGILHTTNAAFHLYNGVHCREGGISGLAMGNPQYACGTFLGAKVAQEHIRNIHFPPLPRSPTHSWLGKAMPLASSANKCPPEPSRLSSLNSKAAIPAADRRHR